MCLVAHLAVVGSLRFTCSSLRLSVCLSVRLSLLMCVHCVIATHLPGVFKRWLPFAAVRRRAASPAKSEKSTKSQLTNWQQATGSWQLAVATGLPPPLSASQPTSCQVQRLQHFTCNSSATLVFFFFCLLYLLAYAQCGRHL